nr:nucleophosmin-like [Penaeus vannamei]
MALIRPLNLLVFLLAIISITNAKPAEENRVNLFEIRHKRDLSMNGREEEEDEEGDDDDDDEEDDDEGDGMIIMVRQVVGGQGGCKGRRGCP